MLCVEIRGQPSEASSSFHRVGPRDQGQPVRLGSKHPYHPMLHFLNILKFTIHKVYTEDSREACFF